MNKPELKQELTPETKGTPKFQVPTDPEKLAEILNKMPVVARWKPRNRAEKRRMTRELKYCLEYLRKVEKNFLQECEEIDPSLNDEDYGLHYHALFNKYADQWQKTCRKLKDSGKQELSAVNFDWFKNKYSPLTDE